MAILSDSALGSSGGSGVLPDWLLQALQGAQAQAGVQQPYNAMGGPFAQPQGQLSLPPQQAQQQAPQQAQPLPPATEVGNPPQPGPPQAAMAQAPIPQAAPPQAAPQAAPAGLPGNLGIGGRLGAGLMGFANSSAPLPALGNLISGLITGQRSDPQGIRLESQAAAYKAIKAAGGSEAQAIAGATNTDVFKALAPDLFGAPKVVKTGTDILGRDIMKLQQGAKFSDIPSQAGGGAAGSGGAAANVDPSKPIYGQLPKPQQDIVDQMLAGRKAPPTSFALKTQYWQTLQAAASEKAAEKGGMFDETTWGQRFKAAQDLAPQGRSGKTINALDTVQGHIGDKLVPAIDKLEKSGIAPNWPIANWFQDKAAGFAPALMKERTQAVTTFNNAKKAVVDEMGNAYKAGHLSDHEVKEWSALIDGADSIIKLRQASSDFVDLLNTKRQTTINQYAGLDVPFKGANETENQRITKLVHDKNAGITDSAAPAAPQQLTPQDQAALNWANSNKSDPRAAAIKQRLGIQ